MAGHSKWSNIKHRKEKSDAQRGKIFTKLGREIAVAVKEGGPDPNTNSKLNDAIAKAKAANMPNDSIARSIKRAAGDVDTQNFEQIVYEGYGAGGVAVIVEAMTDNRNRTAGDLRHIFDKHKGNLGQTGCVSFMFERKGVIIIEKNDATDEEDLMSRAIDLGAEDFTAEEEFYEIITEPASFSGIRKELEKVDYTFLDASVQMVSDTKTILKDEEQAEQVRKLIDSLEDLDDVQNLYHNWQEEDE